jgi:hypothetical protein
VTHTVVFRGEEVRDVIKGTMVKYVSLTEVKPGWTVLIKEAWCNGDRWIGKDIDPPSTIRYRADGYVRTFTGPGEDDWFHTDTKLWSEPDEKEWQQARFMQPWMCRIALEITAVAAAGRLHLATFNAKFRLPDIREREKKDHASARGRYW